MDICMIFILYQLFLTTGIPCTKNKKYHTIRTFIKSTRKVVETKAIKSGSVKLFFILLLKYTSFSVPNTVQSIYLIRLFDCTFGSSLPPVVCRRAYVLFTIVVLVRVKWCPTHIVFCFLFVFLFFVVVSFFGLSILDCPYQGRIQDFKLGGAHFKKLRRAEGCAKMFEIFRVKKHDFTPKNHIFSYCGGRRKICWGISCEKSRFYAKKSYFFQF